MPIRKPKVSDNAAASSATIYESAKRELKRLEKEKSDAKATILKWLGARVSGSLPDGRIISKVVTPYAACTIDRGAYLATSLSIQHPLPATAQPRRGRTASASA